MKISGDTQARFAKSLATFFARPGDESGQALLRCKAVRRGLAGRAFSATTVSTTPPGITRFILRLVMVALP